MLTAQRAWPKGPETAKNALCDAWIKQSAEIEEAEKDGQEGPYVAWRGIRRLRADAVVAVAAAGEPDGLTGQDFGTRLTAPALAILGRAGVFALWAAKNTKTPKERIGEARQTLAAAAATMQGLAAKAATAASIGVTEDDGNQYWQPFDTAMGSAEEALTFLCPRMMNVRNAATICGQAKDQFEEHCLVLTDNGVIRALAMRTATAGVSMQVHDIIVEPRALQQGADGLGGMLLEYIIREAASQKLTVTLLPVSELAKAIYTSMGFAPVKGGSAWYLADPEKYLKKHQVFASLFRAPS